MSSSQFIGYDPRKIEVYPAGTNRQVIENSRKEDAYYDSLVRAGVPVLEKRQFWTDADIAEVVRAFEYLRDHLPVEAFRLGRIPGLGIFVEDDCVALGSHGGAPGAYSVIRTDRSGSLVIRDASDRDTETGGMVAYRRFSDAVKKVLFDWLRAVADYRRQVFYPAFCDQEAVLEDLKWDTHRHLFTPEEQQAWFGMVQYSTDSPATRERAIERIERGSKVARAKNDPDRGFFIYSGAPILSNLSYGLGVDLITFMDRLVVGIAERKREQPQE